MFTKTIKAFSMRRSFKNSSVGACACILQLARRLSDYSTSVLAPREPHLELEDLPEPHVLEPAREDLSLVAPHLPNTFNFAAYVNRSETLQNLVKLGVNLSKIEKMPPYIVEAIMKMEFERDMKKHLFFMKDFVGDEGLGEFITKNPMIFKQELQDLEVRINYLMWKKFKHVEIQRIVTKNPFWLMFSTKRIDRRLGHFQQRFELSGEEVRALATRQPKIITYNMFHINTNTFVVKEEMGFSDDEMKTLLLNKPKIWMMNQLHLIRRFNYVHNVMKISHERIVGTPQVLLSRQFRIQQRHTFLERLGRAQYDPTQANYVPLTSLAAGTDVEFCKNIAKCTVDDFNTFLKTL